MSLTLAGAGCSAGSKLGEQAVNGGSPNGGSSEQGGGVTLGGTGGANGRSGGANGGTGTIITPTGGTTGNEPCTDGSWRCKIVECESRGLPKTTVTAKVYDPAGRVPLYNVAVYVPNSAVAPIADGAACETCATPVSGNPVAAALTRSDGTFVMEDVPAGVDVPLVIQIGKWRREITLSEVKQCQNNAFDHPDLFRLPRNQSEGHIPKMAMTTGEADSLECLMRRIGVDGSEFTNPEGPGRINLFSDPCTEGDCGEAVSSYANGGDGIPNAYDSLWNGVENLRKYDIVFMSCTGSQAAGRDKTTDHKQALKDYVDSGGRAFIEHYHYAWLRGGNEAENIEDARKYEPTPFPVVATWATPDDENIDVGSEDSLDYSIDTGFPKGSDFADWLVNVGATPTRGVISLLDVKHPALAVEPVAQRWIYRDTTDVEGVSAVPFFTVNTPIEQAATPETQCGRFVHTGIHVAVAASDETDEPFDEGCADAPLTPQEMAMEFLIFDLSSCVMKNDVPPEPPGVVR